MVKLEAVILDIGIGFFPLGASFYQHAELFLWKKIQLFEGCLLALIICLILLFSNLSPFLEAFFISGMYFFSASSMSPKGAHAICKDWILPAKPSDFFWASILLFT